MLAFCSSLKSIATWKLGQSCVLCGFLVFLRLVLWCFWTWMLGAGCVYWAWLLLRTGGDDFYYVGCALFRSLGWVTNHWDLVVFKNSNIYFVLTRVQSVCDPGHPFLLHLLQLGLLEGWTPLQHCPLLACLWVEKTEQLRKSKSTVFPAWCLHIQITPPSSPGSGEEMQLPCVCQDRRDYSVTFTMLIVVIPGSRKGVRDTLLGGRVPICSI